MCEQEIFLLCFGFISFCFAESAAVNEELLGVEQPAVKLLGCLTRQSCHTKSPSRGLSSVISSCRQC